MAGGSMYFLRRQHGGIEQIPVDSKKSIVTLHFACVRANIDVAVRQKEQHRWLRSTQRVRFGECKSLGPDVVRTALDEFVAQPTVQIGTQLFALAAGPRVRSGL